MAQYPSELFNLGQAESGDMSLFTDSHVTAGVNTNEALLNPWTFAFDNTLFTPQVAQQDPGIGLFSPNAIAWMPVDGAIFGNAPVASLEMPAGEAVELSTVSAPPVTALRTTSGSHDAIFRKPKCLGSGAVDHPPYRCACGTTFARLDALNRHRNRTPKFECPECKNYDGVKAFKRRDHLMQHLRTYHRLDDKGMARYVIRQRRH